MKTLGKVTTLSSFFNKIKFPEIYFVLEQDTEVKPRLKLQSVPKVTVSLKKGTILNVVSKYKNSYLCSIVQEQQLNKLEPTETFLENRNAAVDVIGNTIKAHVAATTKQKESLSDKYKNHVFFVSKGTKGNILVVDIKGRNLVSRPNLSTEYVKQINKNIFANENKSIPFFFNFKQKTLKTHPEFLKVFANSPKVSFTTDHSENIIFGEDENSNLLLNKDGYLDTTLSDKNQLAMFLKWFKNKLFRYFERQFGYLPDEKTHYGVIFSYCPKPRWFYTEDDVFFGNFIDLGTTSFVTKPVTKYKATKEILDQAVNNISNNLLTIIRGNNPATAMMSVIGDSIKDWQEESINELFGLVLKNINNSYCEAVIQALSDLVIYTQKMDEFTERQQQFQIDLQQLVPDTYGKKRTRRVKQGSKSKSELKKLGDSIVEKLEKNKSSFHKKAIEDTINKYMVDGTTLKSTPSDSSIRVEKFYFEAPKDSNEPF